MSIENKTFSVYVFTKNGVDTLIDVIAKYLKSGSEIVVNLSGSAKSRRGKFDDAIALLELSNITVNAIDTDLKKAVKRDFSNSDAIVFISATITCD